MKKLLFPLLAVLLLILLSACRQQTFDGSRTADDRSFALEFSVLTDTKTHEMELPEGAVIDVSIDRQSGRLDLLVTGDDGEELYRGDDASSGEFSLEVQKPGTVHFSVTGQRAKGSVRFSAKD